MPDEDVTEEARSVVEALNQVEQIKDPVQRAVAITGVLKDYKERAPKLRRMQQEAVLLLRSEKVSYRQIAATLNLSLGAVQNLERGHGSAWGTKSRRKNNAEEATDS